MTVELDLTPGVAEYQPDCTCVDCRAYGPCSESKYQSTGSCWTTVCTHYGTEVDGGLCEGCYVASK